MPNIIPNLQQTFEENRNAENAVHMEKYMRNMFPFMGLKSQERRNLARTFMKEAKNSELTLEQLITVLWELPEREYQYVAVDYLVKEKRKLEKQHLKIIEYMITTKSWWDTVDRIASHLVGELFKNYPELIETIGKQWLKSDNIWLQRSMLLFPLKYKEQTDERLLFAIIEQLQEIDEFFIQKAIGWALREYSKTDPDAVRSFIQGRTLSNLAVREGSKYI